MSKIFKEPCMKKTSCLNTHINLYIISQKATNEDSSDLCQ